MTSSGMVRRRGGDCIMVRLVTREGVLCFVDEVRHGGRRYVGGVLGCTWVEKESLISVVVVVSGDLKMSIE